MRNLSSIGRDYYVIKFNGRLPVTIEVLEETGYNRYQLKIGHQEMSTKSLKALTVGNRYWANFSQTREGMLSINRLIEKPHVLQNELNFLQIVSWDEIDSLVSNGKKHFKDWIINSMELAPNKNDFLMLTSMLLALNEGIYHLPFKIEKRPFLLQWKESLNENLVEFYFAFDTLGAIKGKLGGKLELDVLYEKTASLLKENADNEETSIRVVDTLMPIWKGDNGILDVKG